MFKNAEKTLCELEMEAVLSSFCTSVCFAIEHCLFLGGGGGGEGRVILILLGQV